jgi:hypothetical protein
MINYKKKKKPIKQKYMWFPLGSSQVSHVILGGNFNNLDLGSFDSVCIMDGWNK